MCVKVHRNDFKNPGWSRNTLNARVTKREITQENFMEIYFMYLESKNIYCRRHAVLSQFYFPQNDFYVTILCFFSSNNTFFTNQELKFKYPT